MKTICHLTLLTRSVEPSGDIAINDKLQSKEFYTDLDGKWDFYEKELLTPDEVKEQIRNGEGRMVLLPSSFEAQTGEVNAFGTYSATIKIPEEYVGETLAITTKSLDVDIPDGYTEISVIDDGFGMDAEKIN